MTCGNVSYADYLAEGIHIRLLIPLWRFPQVMFCVSPCSRTVILPQETSMFGRKDPASATVAWCRGIIQQENPVSLRPNVEVS